MSEILFKGLMPPSSTMPCIRIMLACQSTQRYDESNIRGKTYEGKQTASCISPLFMLDYILKHVPDPYSSFLTSPNHLPRGELGNSETLFSAGASCIGG